MNQGRQKELNHCLLFALVLLGISGCLNGRSHVEKKLMEDQRSPLQKIVVAEAYRVSCPDVLEVNLAGRPNCHWRATIGPDGRLAVEELGYPRIDGLTTDDVAKLLARRFDIAPEEVHVHVLDYRSRVIYLFGQVKGAQQSVAYKGPETVLELLRRTGGITPGAEPTNVYVIRSHIAEDAQPEVFHVDLRAIVLEKNHKTNVRLQPYDQIHVGETRQAKIERCIPPWLRPLFQTVCNTRPADKPHKTHFGQHLANNRWLRGERLFARPTTSTPATPNPRSAPTKRVHTSFQEDATPLPPPRLQSIE